MDLLRVNHHRNTIQSSQWVIAMFSTIPLSHPFGFTSLMQATCVTLELTPRFFEIQSVGLCEVPNEFTALAIVAPAFIIASTAGTAGIYVCITNIKITTATVARSQCLYAQVHEPCCSDREKSHLWLLGIFHHR